MYFRCGHCLGASWFEGVQPPRAGDRLRCARCERVHRAVPSEWLGGTIAQHYAASLRLANERSIDIASAYSVLLGVLTEERLAGFGKPAEASAGGEGAAKVRKSPSTDALGEFDPAFREAIESGHLSVGEAIRRGDRKSFAVNLAMRHGLSLTTAYSVADNRLSLREAVSRNRASKPVPRRRRTDHVSRSHVIVTLTAAALLVSTLSWDLWSRNLESVSGTLRSRPTRMAPRRAVEPPAVPERAEKPDLPRELPGLVDVRRNPAGEIIEVVGPDPRTVLAAFCDAYETPGALEPYEITETEPRRNEARLGVFRDYSDAGRYRAIWMRRDWKTRRWVAGDGKVPIPVRDASGASAVLAAERLGRDRLRDR